VSDKVSLVEVVRNTFVIFRSNSKFFLMLILALVVCDFAYVWAQFAPDEYSPLKLAALFGALLFGYPWILQKVMHNSVSLQRGKSEPLGKSWKFFLGLIALSLVSQVLGFVVAFGLSAFALVLSADLLTALLGVLSPIVSFLFMVRFGFILPAIAVDDQYDYTYAWRLGKKHVLRLFLTIIPYFVVTMSLGLLLLPVEGTTNVTVFTFKTSGLSVVSSILCCLSLMAYSVWYVKLKERYDSINKEEAMSDVERKIEKEFNER